MMDVVSRKCQVAGCLKRPWYSYDGVRSVLCAEHKIPGMVGYRPAQKDVAGGVGGGGVSVGMSGAGGGVGSMSGALGGGESGAGRKRTYADMSIRDHPQYHSGHHQDHRERHHHEHPGLHVEDHGGGGNEHGSVGAGRNANGTDLVPDALVDSVGSLEAMGMGEVETVGLQEDRALGLDGMKEVLDRSRMEVGVEVGLEVGVDGLAGNLGQGGLDPTGMESTDHHYNRDLGQRHHHHDHGGLEQRGLEAAGLDVGGGHNECGHRDDVLDLQPVLPAHVEHAVSLVGSSDKLFQ